MNSMEQFLSHLQEVATSPYALIAYVVIAVLWALVTIKTSRLKAIAGVIKDLPENERVVLLEKDYGYHLKEGMSAGDFLRAQKATYLFYAALSIIVAILVISVVA